MEKVRAEARTLKQYGLQDDKGVYHFPPAFFIETELYAVAMHFSFLITWFRQ